MAFDSFGNGGGKAWQTPAPAEKPESAAAAGHSLAPTMRVGGGPTDGCSSRPDLEEMQPAEPRGPNSLVARHAPGKCAPTAEPSVWQRGGPPRVPSLVRA